MTNLTDLTEWHRLEIESRVISSQHLRHLFTNNPNRVEQFSATACDIFLDYSRNLITPTILSRLCDLANARGLKDAMLAQFTGRIINNTENRPALHSALRDLSNEPLYVNNNDIKPQIHATLAQMRRFVTQIHQDKWLGVTGKPIKHIVNIGIGGSYTGPKMCVHALKPFAVTDLKFHFLASVDRGQLDDLWTEINPEQTLFILSSKSFTTIETLTNAKTVIHWMKARLGEGVMAKHFVAVTAKAALAQEFGIRAENIFAIWDWVGGRYSIWSAIGLPLMLLVGIQGFNEFLSGANAMDKHFLQADFANNLPVILGLLGVWYTNFFNSNVQAIIPYSHRLRYLIPYLQQADMESNGKSVDKFGKASVYNTGPVIFGEEGVIGQHAYHQLLHQGNHYIPADFILVGSEEQDEHYQVLIASALSQAQALMQGKTWSEAKAELIARNIPDPIACELAHHQVISGNKPSNILVLKQLNPKTLGALIALYEHKIFVQGIIWGINSFDQWGVELGKQLLPGIMANLQDGLTDTGLSQIIQHLKD